jgi:hypothetical protein
MVYEVIIKELLSNIFECNGHVMKVVEGRNMCGSTVSGKPYAALDLSNSSSCLDNHDATTNDYTMIKDGNLQSTFHDLKSQLANLNFWLIIERLKNDLSWIRDQKQ